MNKEEILERSRNSQTDEYMILQRYRNGTRLFIFIILLLIMLDSILLRITDLTLIFTILWIYLTAHFYATIKENRNLTLFFSISATIVCLITYLTRII